MKNSLKEMEFLLAASSGCCFFYLQPHASLRASKDGIIMCNWEERENMQSVGHTSQASHVNSIRRGVIQCNAGEKGER